MNNEQYKPGVAVIAFGILIFTLLFIFVKRQIMRFAQKFATDGPHAPIGFDAPKKLVKEIEQSLDFIKTLRFEPRLINANNKYACEENKVTYKHFYRMKVMDSVKDFEDFIVQSSDNDLSKRKNLGQDLHTYLLELCKNDGPLSKCDTPLIDSLVQCYNAARYESFPDFGPNEYENFESILENIKSRTIQLPIETKKTCDKTMNRKSSRNTLANFSFKSLSSPNKKSNTR